MGHFHRGNEAGIWSAKIRHVEMMVGKVAIKTNFIKLLLPTWATYHAHDIPISGYRVVKSRPIFIFALQCAPRHMTSSTIY